MGLAGLLVLSINEAVNAIQGKKGVVHFVPVYVLWTAICVILGTEAATAVSGPVSPNLTLAKPASYGQFLDIFVPLVGR
jgi:hypothetical protein